MCVTALVWFLVSKIMIMMWVQFLFLTVPLSENPQGDAILLEMP